ncbi:proton-coupled amino acid transporter-like protein pathetic isoform X3 [Halyomorpha halys]|uniref:proton-coupled amino acid transporter-like protein pathetic isoform X3 n=1 Tax=Halyomorpha halys TaxID=286706 RepID=UPI0034D2878D
MTFESNHELMYLLPSGDESCCSIKSKDRTIEPRKALEGCKVNPTSDLDALLHVIKSSLSTGVLAIPNGFKNAGLLIGILGTISIGILCTHCAYIMVKCAQDLCQILDRPFLGYTETVEQAMLNCAQKKFSQYARFAKNTVDMFMFFTYYGVNTVYIIFVATTVQHITENQFHIILNVRFYILTVAIPVFFVGIIGSMKYLVPFSAIANLFLLIGLCLTFYYILQDLPPISSRPLVVGITHWPFFISTAFFGLEGIGTMLPIENSMKNPHHFLSFPGVLIIAMVIVVSLFTSVGFLGYLKYGNHTEGSITLNLPRNLKAEAVKLLIALAVLFTYGLQLTASMEVIWKRLEKYFDDERKYMRYYQVRAILILGTVIGRQVWKI